MRLFKQLLAAGICVGVAASTAVAQGPTTATPNTIELGVDAGAVFGLGSQSSVDITLPASRFRIGWYLSNPSWSVEPAIGLGYHKVSGVTGVFDYNLELGALYHFIPYVVTTDVTGPRVTSPYVRPFVNVTGYSGGGSSSEFSAGVGLGLDVPWRRQLAIRMEGNFGYGFSRDAGRIGLLAGLSYFPR